MGGEQAAASVLATVHRDADKWTPEEAEAFKAPIRQRYEAEGNPYYATARLWDDGITGGRPEDRGYRSAVGRRFQDGAVGHPSCWSVRGGAPARGAGAPRRAVAERFCMGAAWRYAGRPRPAGGGARSVAGRAGRWGSRPA